MLHNFTVVLIIILASSLSFCQKNNPKNYAVVIGVNGKNEPVLNFADDDARAFSVLLEKSNFNVLLLADTSAMYDRLAYFMKNVHANIKRGDNFFLYFAGHSTTNQRDSYISNKSQDSDFQLLLNNADPINHTNTIQKIFFEDYQREFVLKRGANFFVFLDVCNAEDVAEITKYANSQKNTIMWVLSAGENQQSIESTQISHKINGRNSDGAGLFTHSLIESFTKKPMDVCNENNIQNIKLIDLQERLLCRFNSMHKNLINIRQTPKVISSDSLIYTLIPIKIISDSSFQNSSFIDTKYFDPTNFTFPREFNELKLLSKIIPLNKKIDYYNKFNFDHCKDESIFLRFKIISCEQSRWQVFLNSLETEWRNQKESNGDIVSPNSIQKAFQYRNDINTIFEFDSTYKNEELLALKDFLGVLVNLKNIKNNDENDNYEIINSAIQLLEKPNQKRIAKYTFNLLSKLHLKNCDKNKAKSCLEELHYYDITNPVAYNGLAILKEDESNNIHIDTIIHLYQKAISYSCKKYDSPYVNLALFYSKIKEADSAKKYIDLALQVTNDHHNRYTEALIYEKLNNSGSINVKEKYLRLLNTPDGMMDSRIYVGLGNTYFNSKSYDSASYYYEKAISLNPKSDLAWKNFALSLKKLKILHLRTKEILVKENVYCKNPNYWNILGQYYYTIASINQLDSVKKNYLENALDYYEKALIFTDDGSNKSDCYFNIACLNSLLNINKYCKENLLKSVKYYTKERAKLINQISTENDLENFRNSKFYDQFLQSYENDK